MAEGGSSDLVKDDPDSFIISGVIDGVKQSFIDNGVDTEILAQLERLWVSKLKANTSGGLSITDVLGAPEPVKKTRSGGEGSSAPEMKSTTAAPCPALCQDWLYSGNTKPRGGGGPPWKKGDITVICMIHSQ